MKVTPTPLLWDNHIYLPQLPGTAAIEQIERHREAGFNVVFLNLGDSDRDFEAVLRMAAFCRRWLMERTDRFILIKDLADVALARATGRLAVGFNVEGLYSLGDQLDAVSLYRDIGVRWALFVYNRANALGYGIHDDEDRGLSAFGRQVAHEMDRVGIIKCLSHTGHRTVMDILTSSDLPCIFSHSNAFAVNPHARNIPDDLMRACAERGGVIGVNGIGLFLGPGGNDPALMADHIDHVVQVTGIDHVGIGTDFGYSASGEPDDLAADPRHWPPGHGYDLDHGPHSTVPPEEIGLVFGNLRRRGYADADIQKIMGLNMLRVAEAVWKT